MQKGVLIALVLVLLVASCFVALADLDETPASTPSSSDGTTLPMISAGPSISTRPSTAATVPTTAPTEPTTVPTEPATVPTEPATAPTEPTQPTLMSTDRLTYPTMDWVTDRNVVPFEDRFKEDVPFGNYPEMWIVPNNRNSYSDYDVFYLWGLSVAMENGMEREYVYNIPVDPYLLAGFSYIAADGRWAYLCSDGELCRLDLVNGDLTTLAEKNIGDIRWEVYACGKDTVCIFQLDAERNLRIYYRDLHSKAERTLYQGVLPDVPTSENDLLFYAPSTTQGQVYWEMQNPAFREVYLKELNDPNSPLKDSAVLYTAVQEHYNIPMLVRYSCDFHTGELTEDFGLYDTCWQTKNCKHNHFDYEITREDIPEILNVAPTEIPNIAKPTGSLIFDECETVTVYMYSEFGYGQPYLSLDYPTWKLADFAVIQSEISYEFVYCITAEGTIVQFGYKDDNYKTIYSSENQLGNLFSCGDLLYFTDGNTIVCIDTVAGTYRPIIQTDLKEIFIVGTQYIHYPHNLYFRVRQGMYYKEYRYYPETNEIKEESFIP